MKVFFDGETSVDDEGLNGIPFWDQRRFDGQPGELNKSLRDSTNFLRLIPEVLGHLSEVFRECNLFGGLNR